MRKHLRKAWIFMLLAVTGLVMGAEPSQYYDGTGRPYPSLHTDQYTNLYNARGYGKFYGVIFDSKKLDEELYSRYCVNWFACNIHGKSSWDRVEQDIGNEKTKKFEAEKQAVHAQIASLDQQIASIEANRPELQGEMKKRYDRATAEINRLEGLIADKGKEDASFTGEFEAEAGRYLNDLEKDLEEQKAGSDAGSHGPKEASWKGALDAAEVEGQSLASGVFGVPAAEVKYTYKTPKTSEFGSRLFEAQRYQQGAEGYIKSLASDPHKAERLGLLDYSDVYLGLADQYNAIGQSRDGSLFLNAALNAIDLAIGFVPGVSLGYDLLQIGLGRNPLTGEKLSDLDRGILIGTILMPAALSGAGKTIVKLAGFLKKMPDSKLAGDLAKVIDKSDKAASEALGRVPCVAALERSFLDKIHAFIVPVAYACPPAGTVTDEVVGKATGRGLSDSDDIVEFANDMPNLKVEVPLQRLAHINADHNINEFKNQWGRRPKASFEGYLAKNSFFDSSWSSEKIGVATEIAFNRALNAGITNGEFPTTVFGRSVDVALKNGELKSAWGDFKFTLSKLGLE